MCGDGSHCFRFFNQVEYMILKFDHENRKIQLSLRGEEICNTLQEKEHNGAKK